MRVHIGLFWLLNIALFSHSAMLIVVLVQGFYISTHVYAGLGGYVGYVFTIKHDKCVRLGVGDRPNDS